MNFEEIILGMEAAVNGGAGKTAGVAALKDIIVCGKTGTAQNPHGKEHSVFVAFAPKDDPKIAIMVFVENAGFGATYAAPIASLMIEKYLRGEITNKDTGTDDAESKSNVTKVKRNINIWNRIDKMTIILFLIMIIMGWFNIYAAVFNEERSGMLDITQRYGKQFIWIIAAHGYCGLCRNY